MIDRVRAAAAAIQAAGVSPGGFGTRGFGLRVADGEVLIGLEADGTEHLLVPVRRPGPEDAAGRDVQVRNATLEIDGVSRAFTDVRCRPPRAGAWGGRADVCDHLIADMAEAVEASPATPAEVCIEVLGLWRELLAPSGREALSPSSLAGLVGELLLLKEIVSLDPRRRVDSWVGPAGGRHDFRRGRAAIEVKTTLSTTGSTFTAHGLDQLLEPEGGRLWIAWIRLERVPEGGVSVESLQAELLALGVPARALMKTIADEGCPPDLLVANSAIRFEIRERAYFEVEASFPRLTVKELVGGAAKPGVGDVRYSVDVSHVTPLDARACSSVLMMMARDGLA